MNSTDIRDGFNRSVKVNFQNKVSSVAGIIPAIHKLRVAGFFDCVLGPLAQSIEDKRTPALIRHSVSDMVMQRFASLLVGHEDLNDVSVLENDPAFMCALGKTHLASTPTLCRFERTIEQKTIDKGNELLLQAYFRYAPQQYRYITIDVDNTPVPTFGAQEGRKFNGHYDCNCYLPLLAFINGFPVGVFNGTQDGHKTMVKEFGAMVDAIQKRWPDCIILLRADSGFNSTELIDLCDEKGVFYLIGLAPNKGLMKKMEDWEPQFMDVLQRPPLHGGNLLRHYGEAEDYQAASWSGPRRVIARDYWSEERQEWDARFIQTNIPRTPNKVAGRLAKYTAKELYEQVYCERGLAEQYNQEFKMQAFGARVSSSSMLTNSYRMILAALCQLAYRILRRNFFTKNTPWYDSTLRVFRRAFICIGGVVDQFKTGIRISLNPMPGSENDVGKFWRMHPT